MAKSVVLIGSGAIGRATIQAAVHRNSIKLFQRFPLNVLVDPAYAKKDDPKNPDIHRLWLHLTACPQRRTFREELQDRIRAGSDGKSLVVDGRHVEVIVSKDPENYASALKDALVYDASGLSAKGRDFPDKLLDLGAGAVFITAPASHADSHFVYGYNHDTAITPSSRVISALSCTTNAMTFPVAVIHEIWGISHGVMETTHAYTSDQNLHDGVHSDPRRGRGIAGTINASSTGAAEAIGLAIPALKGRLTDFANRGNWPDGSIVKVYLWTEKPLSNDDLYKALLEAQRTRFAGRMAVNLREDYVLSDVVGDEHASVVDIGLRDKGYTRIAPVKATFDPDVVAPAITALVDSLAGKLDDGKLVQLSTLLRAAVFGNVVMLSIYYCNVFGTANSYLLGAEYVVNDLIRPTQGTV